jgi:putative endonuclease
MKKNHLETGATGEDLAVEYLLKRNYLIQERNWRCKHFEIDIIATYQNLLVFVEVKTRKTLEFGYPEESIGKIKMKRLKLAATVYHFNHPQFKRIQFNVISILLQNNQPASIEMFEDVYFY